MSKESRGCGYAGFAIGDGGLGGEVCAAVCEKIGDETRHVYAVTRVVALVLLADHVPPFQRARASLQMR
jgi:hypothetical protein